MSNKLIIILSVLVILLIVFAIIGRKKGIIGSSKGTEVAVTEVSKRTIIETVSASGKIHPEIEVKISADVSGEIIELYVEEGDSVAQGKLLLKIKPDIYESAKDRSSALLNQMKANEASAKAQLAQVQAQYNQSKSAYDRNVKLFEQKVISDAEFEAATASYQTAVANRESGEQSLIAAKFNVLSSMATLKEANDNLNKTLIYAPISGIISKLNVEKGERVVGTIQMTGTEILRIADLNNMEARVDVSENDVLRVSTQDTAFIEVDAYIDKKFLGKVTQIAHSPNQDMQISAEQVTNFRVDIKLLRESYKELIKPETGHKFPFRPGMSSTVEILTEKVYDVIAVPIQAVTTREEDSEKKDKKQKKDDGEKEDDSNKKSEKELSNVKVKEYVFVVSEDKVKLVEVKTGIQDDEYIQILSGVTESDKVVTAPFRAISKTLKNDDAVIVVTEKELFEEEK